MSGGRYPHIIRSILASPWAIDETSLAWAAILDVIELRALGERLSDDEIEARIAAASNGPRGGGGRQAGVALLTLYGVMVPRANLMSRMSGGTSAELLGAQLEAAAADPDVSAIVIDVDSPGGNVQGVTELAATVRRVAERKPIAAVAYHDMASAALWAMSGATELVATPSARVGSIGVITAIEDDSAAREKAGVRRTFISAGKFKAEDRLPPSDESIAHEQALVNEVYGVMTGDIAKGRGVSAATVRGADWGEGRWMFGQRALDVGMVDRIGSLEETIRRAARGELGQDTSSTSAEANEAPIGDPSTDAAPSAAAAPPAAAPAPHESPRVAPARRADLRLRLARGGYDLPATAGR